MKKKIALFLAAVMTFAVIAPMNLMAGSSATTTRKISGHGDDVLVPQDTLNARGWKVVGVEDFADETATGLGANLKITFSDAATPGDLLGFTVDLENADWAFLSQAGLLNNGEPRTIHVDDDGDPDTPEEDDDGVPGVDTKVPNMNFDEFDASFNEGAAGTVTRGEFEVVDTDGEFVTALYYPGSSGVAWQGDWDDTVTALAGVNNTSGREVAYYMQIDSGYKLSASIQYATGDELAKDAVIMLPLVIKTYDDGPVVAKIDMGQDVTPQDVTITSTSTGTRAKVDKVADGTDEVEIRPLIIEEYSANTMKNGKFKITAPKGYEFKVDDDDYPVKADGSTPVDVNVTNFGGGRVTTQKATKAGTVLNFTIENKTATQIQATIRISGLVLQPTDADNVKYNTKLAITIEDNQKGDTKITKQTLDVAKFVKASILYKAEDAEDIKSGYRDQETAKLTMEEQTATDSWWARRDTTFTLTDANGDVLDGVKFTSADVEISNLNDAPDGVLENDDAHNGRTGTGNKAKADRFYYNGDGNVLTIMSMTHVSDTKKGKLVATFNLSADINFEGDVYVKLGSTDIEYKGDNYVENGGIVKIATVKPTIAIETKSTSTQIGAQRISVADIIFSEVNADNMLERNKFIDLKVGQYGNGTDADIAIVPLKDANITVSGDMKVKVESSKYNNAQLKIDRVSMDDLSTFTLSNVQVNINRSVPYGEFELYVSGDAIRDNAESQKDEDDDMRDYFDNEGIMVEKYITVDTAPENPAYSTQVVIYNKNTANAIVNGVATEMGAPTVNINDRLYVPLRFIVLALGGHDTDIVWSNTSRTASITINQRTVTWTEGSNFYIGSNGARVGMDSDATACIVNDRLYIPFGAFAQAFNIPVVWDEVAQTATYNPAVNK